MIDSRSNPVEGKDTRSVALRYRSDARNLLDNDVIVFAEGKIIVAQFFMGGGGRGDCISDTSV